MKGRVKIVRQEFAEAPEDDIVKITYNKRSRYVLGNEAVTADEAAALQERMNAGEVIGIPVYAYVHSGSTIRCSDVGNPFECRWDSGRSGLAYITTADAQREWDLPSLRDVKERAESYIRNFVETFDAYLKGEVYGYVAEKAVVDPDSGEVLDGEFEEEDSCWGFYGFDRNESGMAEAIKPYVDKGYEITEED